MQHPTSKQMQNAERNTEMAQPEIVEPIQQKFDFAERYEEIVDRELDKDVVSLLKLLNKFGCLPETVTAIMKAVELTAPDVRFCQKAPKAI